jgi:hypothetical protein
VTLQCPIKNTVLAQGTKCGRRERESRREGRREQSLRALSETFACRGGERHPGLREGGALRGALSERRPRSVRRPPRVSPRRDRRAGDNGCPTGAEEGNAVGMRKSSACTRRTARLVVACARGRVLRSVRRPVHVNPHYAPGASSEVGRPSGHRGRANLRKQEEPAPGFERTDGARLAACHRSRKGGGVAREKRKEIEVSVPARIEEPGFGCPHVVVQLQKSVGDVWSRISSAHALQKERSGSSERGPSSERRSAGDTVGRRVERNGESRVGLGRSSRS